MTVCVDGLSQEKYQRTRVGGRIDRVLSNLSRVCRFRREYHQPHPRIEVQYLKFQHNLDEVEPARRLFEHMGIDQVTEFWGGLENYTDFNPGNYTVFGPKRNRCIPQCFWAHAGMVVKFDGDVIPCCNYRTGEQYTATDDPKALGNVFQTSLLEVWNSPPYQDVRRIVSNPRIVESEPAFLENFCYGCPILFETDISKQFRSGRRYTFEELYTIGPEGRSVRRRTPPA
jgi:MoaA/NifB/PqqE/SkfB family radical SAM enzyme